MSRMPTAEVDLAECRRWFRRNRDRSRAWFDLLTDEAYEAQPIALRHPVVFYEGHVAAFNVNTLVKLGFGLPGVDADLAAAARIAPDRDSASTAGAWPSRAGCSSSPPPRIASSKRRWVATTSACDRPVWRAARPLHDPRARSDASRDAAVHVPPPPRTRSAGLRYRPVVGGIRRRRPKSSPAGRRRSAPIRTARVRLGQRARPVRSTFPRSRSTSDVSNRDYLEFVDAAVAPISALDARELDLARADGPPAPELLGPRPTLVWRALFDGSPCRSRGRST